jgi:hypothetical protein
MYLYSHPTRPSTELDLVGAPKTRRPSRASRANICMCESEVKQSRVRYTTHVHVQSNAMADARLAPMLHRYARRVDATGPDRCGSAQIVRRSYEQGASEDHASWFTACGPRYNAGGAAYGAAHGARHARHLHLVRLIVRQS